MLKYLFIYIFIEMNSLLFYLILSLFALSHSVDVMHNHINQENNLYFIFTTFSHGARKPLSGSLLW